MCGIIACLCHDSNPLEQVKKGLKTIRHRGPDWTGIHSIQDKNGYSVIGHERLAIIDIDSGAQPIVHKGICLAVNGEIYNYRDFPEFNEDRKTGSDCEVILHLYLKYRDQPPEVWLEQLRGMFAFVLYDLEREYWLAARDPIGIIPLYMTEDKKWFSSEMKAFSKLGLPGKYIDFRPNSYLDSLGNQYDYSTIFWNSEFPWNCDDIREKLEESVHCHLMSDVPFGVLLSGGLDSSLIASIACRYSQKRVESNDQEDAWYPKIHTFSIGLEGSPDLKNAKKVADYLGTVHHEFHFTIDEGLNALQDVIYHLETFDLTTVRASTPMYLLARKIKAMGFKMVLSGEGADELFGGYLYFKYAPNSLEFHEEVRDKVMRLHKYDCLRANKSTMAWGLEVRVPFLDTQFVEFAFEIDTNKKMQSPERPMEKWILRDAFRDSYLPDEILWRQKEQFSDGVGYKWIEKLREYAKDMVPVKDEIETYEERLYKNIFHTLFGKNQDHLVMEGGKSIACSTERALEWNESFKNMIDPSGLSIQSHISKNT